MNMQQLINQLILTAGSWNATGQTDEKLKKDFEGYMKQLQKATGTTFEGAMQILLNSQEVAAA